LFNNIFQYLLCSRQGGFKNTIFSVTLPQVLPNALQITFLNPRLCLSKNRECGNKKAITICTTLSKEPPAKTQNKKVVIGVLKCTSALLFLSSLFEAFTMKGKIFM
jgi:hypothetical protein